MISRPQTIQSEPELRLIIRPRGLQQFSFLPTIHRFFIGIALESSLSRSQALWFVYLYSLSKRKIVHHKAVLLSEGALRGDARQPLVRKHFEGNSKRIRDESITGDRLILCIKFISKEHLHFIISGSVTLPTTR